MQVANGRKADSARIGQKFTRLTHNGHPPESHVAVLHRTRDCIPVWCL